MYIKEVIRYSLKENGEFKEIDTSVYDSERENEDTLRSRYCGGKFAYKTGNDTLSRFYVTHTNMGNAGFASVPGFVYGVTNNLFMVAEPEISVDEKDINVSDVKIFSQPTVENDLNNIAVKTYSINNDKPLLSAMIVENGSAVPKTVSEQVFVVMNKYEAVNSDNEVGECLQLSDGISSVNLFVSDKYQVPNQYYIEADKLNVGDMVRYGTDFNGYMDKCIRVFDYETKTISYYDGYMNSSPRVSGGIVYDVNDIYIYIRVFSKYADGFGAEHTITANNVEDAITEQLSLLEQNYTSANPILTRQPEESMWIVLFRESIC